MVTPTDKEKKYIMGIKKNTVDISVIITTFNESGNIIQWCKSLLNQTVIPKELVVVDSLSSDGTLKLIEDFFEDSEICLVTISKKCNISKGRNLAIKKTTSENLAITDGGVVLDPKWLEVIFTHLAKYEVVSGYYTFGAKNALQEAYSDLFYCPKEFVDAEKFLPSSRSLGLRKYCWESVDGYNESFVIGEDTDFDLKLKGKGFTFNFAPEATVEWELRSNIKAIFKQHYLYSKWDAIIGQNIRGNCFLAFYSQLVLLFSLLSLFSVYFLLSLCVLLVLPVIKKKNRYSKVIHSRFITRVIILNVSYLAKGIGFISGTFFANDK